MMLQGCVRRRVMKSMAANPYCSGSCFKRCNGRCLGCLFTTAHSHLTKLFEIVVSSTVIFHANSPNIFQIQETLPPHAALRLFWFTLLHKFGFCFLADLERWVDYSINLAWNITLKDWMCSVLINFWEIEKFVFFWNLSGVTLYFYSY